MAVRYSSSLKGISFRSAARSDTNRIVDIIIGEPEQVTTQAGMKLFGLRNLDQLNLIMHAMALSTKSWQFTLITGIHNLRFLGSSPTPSTKIAWRVCRAIFSITTLRAKGKARSIRDRNWFFWLKINKNFGSSPLPPTKIAWYANRAIFSISTLWTKGKAEPIGDRNWFFWLKISWFWFESNAWFLC